MKQSRATKESFEYEVPALPKRLNKKRKESVPVDERNHPCMQPYHRTNKGLLHHSLMIDGLGEEDV